MRGWRRGIGNRRDKKDLGITKEGSGLLRWVLIQAAWRLVRLSARWRTVFDNIRAKRGKKKAIVAVARRLLTVLASLWRSGQCYRVAVAGAGG